MVLHYLADPIAMLTVNTPCDLGRSRPDAGRRAGHRRDRSYPIDPPATARGGIGP